MIVCSLVVFSSLSAFAEKKGNLLRGGYGFLFPDANQFVNGGQMALNKGTAVEANYLRDNDSSVQVGTPSLVWANGQTGIGAGVSRTGLKLSEASTSVDTLKVQAGAALASNLTFGGVYSRSLESGVVGSDEVSAQMNVHFGKAGHGVVLGLGAGTTLGNETNNRNGVVGLGYAMSSGVMTEVAYQVDNFADATNNYTYTGSVVYNANSWYAAGRYNHVKAGESEPNNFQARLGMVFGKIDLSGQVSKQTVTDGSTVYGGTMRVVF
jgi:hypothetical protein